MITKRIIPCLDVKDGKTVKGIHFKLLKEVGDPVEMKQAMKDLTYTQCENLARAMADRLKKDR